MKISRWFMSGIVLVGLLLCNEMYAGNLTPPGAPASTMHTLDDLYGKASMAEPRTPISGPATITQPGSYYLATNIYGKISIEADHVTFDLMGFRVRVSSGDAISIPAGDGSNTVIRNGTLRPGAGATALDARYADDCLFENLRIDGDNAWRGIYADDRCVIRNCDVRGCSSRSISVGNHTEVRDCRVIGGTADGIHAGSDCRIVENVIEDQADDGLYITGSRCYVSDNIVRDNGDNYDLADGNFLNLLLSEIPETLNWPCSVKFAGTLSTSLSNTNGITVASDNVTIDMNGHALIGPGENSGYGIYQDSARHDLHVFNGKCSNWRGGSKAGIYASGKGSHLEHVQATTNYYGIYIGDGGSIVKCSANDNTFGIWMGNGNTMVGCAARNNTGHGIFGSKANKITDCASSDNISSGISVGSCAAVSDCAAYNNYSGISAGHGSVIESCAAYSNENDGISAGWGSMVSKCTARYNSGDGIWVNAGSKVLDCMVRQNTEDGIQISSLSHVSGCTAVHNGSGIYAWRNANRIEDNNVVENSKGIEVASSGNFIARNTATGNTTNWDVAAGNVCLVVSASTAGAISGDSGGTAPGSTDPNANFTY